MFTYISQFGQNSLAIALISSIHCLWHSIRKRISWMFINKYTKGDDTCACIMCNEKTTLPSVSVRPILEHRQDSIASKEVHVFQTNNRNVYLTKWWLKYQTAIVKSFTNSRVHKLLLPLKIYVIIINLLSLTNLEYVNIYGYPSIIMPIV